MTAFDMMRNQMFRVMYMIPNMITAKVSLTRVADFLRTVSDVPTGRDALLSHIHTAD